MTKILLYAAENIEMFSFRKTGENTFEIMVYSVNDMLSLAGCEPQNICNLAGDVYALNFHCDD